jgi:hypothetical protein
LKKPRRRAEPNADAGLLKTLTRTHGETAVTELVRLAAGAESESVRLAAIKELLDRGFGRAPQTQAESAAGATMHVLVDDGYGS